MIAQDSKVFVVDDDRSVRDSLSALMQSAGLPVETHASGAEFLAAYTETQPACLLLDVRMPRMSGLAVQNALIAQRSWLPVIIVSAHPDVTVAVRAMKAGAIDFVQKPWSNDDLLETVRRALHEARLRFEHDRARQSFESRLSRLTAREREVLAHVVQGKPSKVIAYDLGITQKTIEIHRSNLMHKMNAASALELALLSVRFPESLADASKRAA